MKLPLEIAFSVNAGDWPDGLESIANAAILAALKQSKAKVKGVAESNANQFIFWRVVDDIFAGELELSLRITSVKAELALRKWQTHVIRF